MCTEKTNWDVIQDDFIRDLERDIERRLEEDKFIDREDISHLFEDVKSRIMETHGVTIFDNPSYNWVMYFSDVEICVMPRVGIHVVHGGNREAKLRLSFPDGTITQLMTYKGFV